MLFCYGGAREEAKAGVDIEIGCEFGAGCFDSVETMVG
jgi:hypothetical protein